MGRQSLNFCLYCDIYILNKTWLTYFLRVENTYKIHIGAITAYSRSQNIPPGGGTPKKMWVQFSFNFSASHFIIIALLRRELQHFWLIISIFDFFPNLVGKRKQRLQTNAKEANEDIFGLTVKASCNKFPWMWVN